MRTTVDLSKGIMEEVMRLSGARTKRDALRIALEDYIRRKSIDALLAASGTIAVDYVRPEMEEAELAEEGVDPFPKEKAKVAERPRRYR